jgi:hypothetical protein
MKDYSTYSEEALIDIVTKNPDQIRWIEDPSEAVQLAVINTYCWSIEFIKKPTLAAQLAAVNRNAPTISRIKNPFHEVKIITVTKHGASIDCINNPTEEMKLLAVKQDGINLALIKNPSEQVQIEAIRNTTEAYFYVKDYNVIKKTKEYWNNRFYYYLVKNIFDLTPEQQTEIIEEYEVLQLFK